MVDYDNFSKALLQRAAEKGIEIDPLKLQKLAYYCQGYHLASYDAPAIDAQICAWDHGPVVKEMYCAYQHHKAQPISLQLSCSIFEELETSVQHVIDRVLDTYGHFSSWTLRNLTHKEAPWMAHYNPVEDKVDYQAISHEEISLFFKERLAGGQDAYFKDLITLADSSPLEIPENIETEEQFYNWIMDDSQSKD